MGEREWERVGKLVSNEWKVGKLRLIKLHTKDSYSYSGM